ncbi:MAG: Gfo/Idh/MocA family oxidoreductase [Firmicutes bacterium]|nr:Gfo/Idh/MocA family oxidoreductase [Bacillota bacterium]
MNKKVRVAIVGCGAIGRVHARAIIGLDEAELVAVCDHSEANAKAMAAEFDCNHYTDYRQMFARENLDLVTVCTPSGTRLDICQAASSAKVNILVEKPLDITVERCQQIVDMCEQAGVKLGSVFQMRFSPVFKRLKQAIDQGRFGRLILGNCQTVCYRSQAYYDSGGWRGTMEHEGGGALMNQGIHSVDLLLWVMGDVQAVSAYKGILTHDIEVEDTVSASIQFVNGAMGTIQATTSVMHGIDKRLEIYGEKGTAIIEGETVVKWEFEDDDLPENTEERRNQLSPSSPLIEDVQGHRDQIQDMIEAIRDNREPAVSGLDGLKAVELVTNIYKAADSL